MGTDLQLLTPASSSSPSSAAVMTKMVQQWRNVSLLASEPSLAAQASCAPALLSYTDGNFISTLMLCADIMVDNQHCHTQTKISVIIVVVV